MTLLRPKYLILTILSVTLVVTLTVPFLAVKGQLVFGDTNVEPVTTNPLDNYVDALTKINVTQPITITSVSLYIQYAGSDGSQCIKFGIYGDNGGSYGQSNPINQPLVASTKNGYCLQLGNFGPAWETWLLLPSDQMTIGPGVYWLATLASQDFGAIYHFTYTGAYGGQFLYNYGYFNYAFPASYQLGFPPTKFANTTYTAGQGSIVPFNPNNIGEYNAPYSFYVTGVPVHPVPEFAPQLVVVTALLIPLLLTTWRRRRLPTSR